MLKDYLPPSTDDLHVMVTCDVFQILNSFRFAKYIKQTISMSNIAAWPTDILPSETFAPDSQDHAGKPLVSNMNIEVDDFMEIQF